MPRLLPFRRLLVVLVALGLLTAACGSSDSDDPDAAGPGEDRVGGVESEGEPQPGGDLVVGVEAETDGWDPTKNNWAVSAHFVASAVYDTLAMFDENGEAQPYLAQEFSSNDEFTEWTITLREGVTFHDGTPLDAAAVKANLDAIRASGLIGPIFRTVTDTAVVDPLTLTVTMSSPWATFPVSLTTQAGYVALPASLTGDTANREPVGTGPFVFEEWVPDSKFVTTKNENYWQEGKPYVDSVEFRPIVEPDQRQDALETGEIDVIHSSDTTSIEDLRSLADDGDIELVEDGAIGEESFVMLNTEVAPVDDVRVRRALAHAIDLESYTDIVDLGVREPAQAPFVEGSPWYSQDAVDAYPEFDVAAGAALIEEYEEEVGPVEIALQDTPGNDEELAFFQQAWQAIGVDVEIVVTEQAAHILDALGGEYQAVGWRLFGNPDPDGEYQWWDIENANPVGEVALNFARLRNEDLQAAMDAGRATQDVAERQEAYNDAQVIINEEVPYIWQTHTLWVFAGQNNVRNLAYYQLPDGTPGLGVYAAFPGASKLTDLWLDE